MTYGVGPTYASISVAGPVAGSLAGSVAGSGLAATAAAPRPVGRTHSSFHELLSELNPLQYLPVIGTLYRALTGDVIPETARNVGSLVVGGLTGGPIGAALAAGAIALEKAVGVDPERLGRSVLAELGIAKHPGPAVTAIAVAERRQAAPKRADGGWSAAQLARSGVFRTAYGDLRQGALSGSDVLNGLELARLGDEARGGKAQASTNLLA